MKIFERGPITLRGLSTCHLSKEKKKYATVPIWKKIFPGIMQHGILIKRGENEEESWAKIIKHINFKLQASSPATPVLPKNTEDMQEGSGSYHLNSNASTAHRGNISGNRKPPITCALWQEKFVLFLTSQLKMKLLFETKMSYPYHSYSECVTFILFFLCNLSHIVNLSF